MYLASKLRTVKLPLITRILQIKSTQIRNPSGHNHSLMEVCSKTKLRFQTLTALKYLKMKRLILTIIFTLKVIKIFTIDLELVDNYPSMQMGLGLLNTSLIR